MVSTASGLDKLSEMYPEIVMEHRWADEDIGCNCGQRTWLGGKIIDEYIPEEVRAKDFAMEMWGYEPAELGLCLNASGTGYIYVDDTDLKQSNCWATLPCLPTNGLQEKISPRGCTAITSGMEMTDSSVQLNQG